MRPSLPIGQPDLLALVSTIHAVGRAYLNHSRLLADNRATTGQRGLDQRRVTVAKQGWVVSLRVTPQRWPRCSMAEDISSAIATSVARTRASAPQAQMHVSNLHFLRRRDCFTSFAMTMDVRPSPTLVDRVLSEGHVVEVELLIGLRAWVTQRRVARMRHGKPGNDIFMLGGIP